jgi:ATP-dependent protease ClpP protease subunit
MLIHQLAGKQWGKWEGLKDSYKNSAAQMELIYNYYEKYSKLKKSKIKTILKHDLYFNAEQCRDYGLVDFII